MNYMNYKDIINLHSKEVEDLYRFFANEPLSVANRIRQAFEDRCGFVLEFLKIILK